MSQFLTLCDIPSHVPFVYVTVTLPDELRKPLALTHNRIDLTNEHASLPTSKTAQRLINYDARIQKLNTGRENNWQFDNRAI